MALTRVFGVDVGNLSGFMTVFDINLPCVFLGELAVKA